MFGEWWCIDGLLMFTKNKQKKLDMVPPDEEDNDAQQYIQKNYFS